MNNIDLDTVKIWASRLKHLNSKIEQKVLFVNTRKTCVYEVIIRYFKNLY